MSAALRIARREVTELWRDGRLAAAGLITLLLIATALAVGWQHQQVFEAERRAAQTLDYEDWLKQNERHPHDAAHQGMHVFKPLPTLAIVDPGITPYAGSTIWLQAHRQSELRFRGAQDTTGLQRFGSLSIAWVLQVLSPLLVIVLGFNMLAGEREQGTLKQTMSLGVPLRTIALGKALALIGVLAVLLLPAVIAMVVTLFASDRTFDDGLRVVLLLGTYSTYLAIIVAMVLAVSAISNSSRAAIAWLLGLWIVSVTLLPRAASDIAREISPSPTRAEFTKALDAETSQAHEEAWRKTFGTTKRWGTELPLSRWGEALRMDDRTGYRVTDKHFAALWDSFASQQLTQEIAGAIAPVLALRSASMVIAGTDFASHRHFATRAEQHRRTMQDIISDDLVKHADPRGAGHFDYQAGHSLWEKIPSFDYAPRTARDALRSAGIALSVLLFNLVCAGALLAWALARRAKRVL